VKHLFINALVFVVVNLFSQESQPGLSDKAILNAQPRRVGNEKKL
jgi:hypothetical protein